MCAACKSARSVDTRWCCVGRDILVDLSQESTSWLLLPRADKGRSMYREAAMLLAEVEWRRCCSRETYSQKQNEYRRKRKVKRRKGT